MDTATTLLDAAAAPLASQEREVDLAPARLAKEVDLEASVALVGSLAMQAFWNCCLCIIFNCVGEEWRRLTKIYLLVVIFVIVKESNM